MTTCQYQHLISRTLVECKSPESCEYAHRYSAGLLKYCEKEKRLREWQAQDEIKKMREKMIKKMLGVKE